MQASSSFSRGQKAGGGRFILIRPLGRGGVSEIWLAQDEQLHRPVAIKFLPPEATGEEAVLEQIRREVERAAQVAHENIAGIYGFYAEPGARAFIAAEYVSGASLAVMRAEQPEGVLGWKKLKPLIGQICDALDAAHSKRVAHGHLKPANIMLDDQGRVKLTDAGITALRGDATGNSSAYMSPQQLTGRFPEASDDIYALGAILYEMLSGKPPFHGKDILDQVLLEAPAPLKDRLSGQNGRNAAPAEASDVVMACLSKEPDQRPRDALTVAEWFDVEAGALPLPGEVEGNVATNQREGRRTWKRRAVIIAVLAGLALGMWWCFFR